MTWDQVKFATELITFMIVAISAVSSTILFFKSKNMMREKESFDSIDDKFLTPLRCAWSGRDSTCSTSRTAVRSS